MNFNKYFSEEDTRFSAKRHGFKKLWLSLVMLFFSAALIFCAFFIPFNSGEKSASAASSLSNAVTWQSIQNYQLYKSGYSGDGGYGGAYTLSDMGTPNSSYGESSFDAATATAKGSKISMGTAHDTKSYVTFKAVVKIPAFTEYNIKFSVTMYINALGSGSAHAWIDLYSFGETDKSSTITFGYLKDANEYDYSVPADIKRNHKSVGTTSSGSNTSFPTEEAFSVTCNNTSNAVLTKTFYFGCTLATCPGSSANYYFNNTATMSSEIKVTAISAPTADRTEAEYVPSGNIFVFQYSSTNIDLKSVSYKKSADGAATDVTGSYPIAADGKCTLTKVGVYTFTFKIKDSCGGVWSDTNDKSEKKVTLTVKKGKPNVKVKTKDTLPNPIYVTYNDGELPEIINYAASPTPGTLKWQEGQQPSSSVSNYYWQFIPDDTENYNSITGRTDDNKIVIPYKAKEIKSLEITLNKVDGADVKIYDAFTLTDGDFSLKKYVTVKAVYSDNVTKETLSDSLYDLVLDDGGTSLSVGLVTVMAIDKETGKTGTIALTVLKSEVTDLLNTYIDGGNHLVYSSDLDYDDIKGNLTVRAKWNYSGDDYVTVDSKDYEIVGDIKAGSPITLTVKFGGKSKDFKPNIDKGDFDISGITLANGSAAHDGAAHGLTIAGALPEGVTAEYLYVCAANGYSSSDQPTDAGEYTVTVSFTHENPNYNAITKTLTATLSIGKSAFPDADKITFENATVSYDGAGHSIAAANVPEGVTVTYVYDGSETSTPPEFTDANLSGYTVTAKFTHSNPNYSDIADKSATLIITKVDYPDADKITFENATVSYSGAGHSITAANVPEGVTVTYVCDGSETSTPPEFTEVNLSGYTVTAKFTHSNPNYNAISDKTATLIITDKKLFDKSGLTASGEGLTFDGKNATATYSGSAFTLTTGGTLKDADGADVALQYTTEVKAKLNGEDVAEILGAGTYTVTVVYTLPDSAEYADYENKFEVKYTVTVAKADYDLSGITLENKSYEYDGQEHALEITGELPEGVSASYEGNGQSDVSTYTVTASFTHSNPNYNEIETVLTAELKIEKRKVTLIIDALSSVAGEELAVLTATVAEGSIVTGEMPYKLVCSADKDAVGEYPVTFEYAEGFADKYEITCESGVYIVSKKAEDGSGSSIDMPVNIDLDFKVIQDDTKKEYPQVLGMASGYYAQLWYKNDDGTLGDEYVDEMNCILTLKVPDDIVDAICADGEATREKIAEKLKLYYIDRDGDVMPVKYYTLSRREDGSWIVKFNYNDKFRAEVVFNAVGIDAPAPAPEQPDGGKFNIPTWAYIAAGAGLLLILLLIIIIAVSRRRRYSDGYDDYDDYDGYYDDDDYDDDYDDYGDEDY